MSTLPLSGLPELATSRDLAEAVGLKLPAFNQAMRKYGPPATAVEGRTRSWDRVAQFRALEAVVYAACYPSRLNDDAFRAAERLIPLVGKDLRKEMRRAGYREAVRSRTLRGMTTDMRARHAEELASLRAEHVGELEQEAERKSEILDSLADAGVTAHRGLAHAMVHYAPKDKVELRQGYAAQKAFDDECGADVARALAAIESGDVEAVAKCHPTGSGKMDPDRERTVYDGYVRLHGRTFEFLPGKLDEAMERDDAARRRERGPGRQKK